MKRLLHFTDLHLHDDPATEWRGVRPQQTFEASLYHARRRHWPADLVLLTGDVANEEFDDSYARLAAAATGWETPLLAVPGNHDNAAAMRAAFRHAGQSVGGTQDVGKWRIIALDSQLPGEVHGQVDEAQRQWLQQQLQQAGERHCLVALHHPPLALGSAWIDNLRLEDDDAFRSLLHRQGAAACVFGHAHQAHDSVIEGVHYLGTPATCVQFLPGSEDFAEDSRPPGYRWLELHDDGSLATGVEWVEA